MSTRFKKAILEVNVTKRHISSAIRKDSRRCAMAQAIVDSDGDIVWANATTTFIKYALESSGRVYKHRTPRVARDFIIDFDAGRATQPFKLRLDDDNFVSEVPRRMHQREVAGITGRRKILATQTGRKLIEVTAEEALEEIPVFPEEPPAKTVKGREPLTPWVEGTTPKVVRPKRPTPRKYNQRQTFADAAAE